MLAPTSTLCFNMASYINRNVGQHNSLCQATRLANTPKCPVYRSLSPLSYYRTRFEGLDDPLLVVSPKGHPVSSRQSLRVESNHQPNPYKELALPELSYTARTAPKGTSNTTRTANRWSESVGRCPPSDPYEPGDSSGSDSAGCSADEPRSVRNGRSCDGTRAERSWSPPLGEPAPTRRCRCDRGGRHPGRPSRPGEWSCCGTCEPSRDLHAPQDVRSWEAISWHTSFSRSGAVNTLTTEAGLVLSPWLGWKESNLHQRCQRPLSCR